MESAVSSLKQAGSTVNGSVAEPLPAPIEAARKRDGPCGPPPFVAGWKSVRQAGPAYCAGLLAGAAAGAGAVFALLAAALAGAAGLASTVVAVIV